MVLATNYPLLNIIWTMLVFTGLVIWLGLMFSVFTDLYRRSDISGWGKALWTLVVIFLPLVGVLAYLIADGEQMAERRNRDVADTQAAVDDHIRTVAGGGATQQISQAKALLDKGAITQAEFDHIKQHALAADGDGAPATTTAVAP